MKVAVPGLFHTLQVAHFLVFDRILAMATRDVPITLVLLAVADGRVDRGALASMLGSIRQVSAVHVVQSASELTEAFLVSKGVDGVASFSAAPFSLNLSWRPHKRIPAAPQFVLVLGDLHPDFAAAQSLFQRRRSPRDFTSEPVSDFAVSSALEAARRAPSAGNLQAYSLVVIKSTSIRRRLTGACLGRRAAPHRGGRRAGAVGGQIQGPR
jgi:hypothetical protein